jgi:hypothetical protein
MAGMGVRPAAQVNEPEQNKALTLAGVEKRYYTYPSSEFSAIILCHLNAFHQTKKKEL